MREGRGPPFELRVTAAAQVPSGREECAEPGSALWLPEMTPLGRAGEHIGLHASRRVVEERRRVGQQPRWQLAPTTKRVTQAVPNVGEVGRRAPNGVLGARIRAQGQQLLRHALEPSRRGEMEGREAVGIRGGRGGLTTAREQRQGIGHTCLAAAQRIVQRGRARLIDERRRLSGRRMAEEQLEGACAHGGIEAHRCVVHGGLATRVDLGDRGARREEQLDRLGGKGGERRQRRARAREVQRGAAVHFALGFGTGVEEELHACKARLRVRVECSGRCVLGREWRGRRRPHKPHIVACGLTLPRIVRWR